MALQGARGESLVGKSFDGFRVMDEVAWTGAATVYRAMQVDANSRIVALKVIDALEQRLRLEQGDSENPMWREQRFSQVAKHPSLVRIFRTGRVPDGRYYAAMEFVEGMSIAEEIRHRGSIPWREAVVVLEQIAGAVGVLHQARIVHRDLKPENVLVRTSRTGAVRAKLIDFGIAKLIHQRDDVDSGVDPKTLSTPVYLAPEVARGLGTSRASDVYAFGALAYEMLAGQNVLGLRGQTPETCVTRILSDRPIPEVPLEHAKASVAPDLLDLIERCLSRSPELRPANGGELHAEFAPIVAHAVESAASQSWLWSRALAWLGRGDSS
jgi:serine/threonine protein kinase